MSIDKHNPDSVTQVPEILTRIRDRLSELSGEERSLAEYIMLNLEAVPRLSLVQLAESAQVSPSAVIQFCDNIGCEGFHARAAALNCGPNDV